MPVQASGAKAFSDTLLGMVAQREEQRLIEEQAAAQREQLEFQRQRQSRQDEIAESTLSLREREAAAREAAGKPPDLGFLDEMNVTPEQRALIRLRASGVSGDLGGFGEEAKGPTGDFGRYLNAYAQEVGKGVDELSARDIEQARRRYGQADDRPYAPILIQTPQGQQIVDRTPGATFDRAPSDAQTQREASNEKIGSIVNDISSLSERINTNYGAGATAVGTWRGLVAKVNEDVDVAEYVSLIDGYVPIVARALGHTGVLTEQDVERTIKVFPLPWDSKDLRDRKISRLQRIIGGGAAAEIAGAGGVDAGGGGGNARPQQSDNPFRRGGG